MAKQRQLLNVRLGLDVASKIGIDFSGIFSNDDLTGTSSGVQELPIKTEDNHVRVIFFTHILQIKNFKRVFL